MKKAGCLLMILLLISHFVFSTEGFIYTQITEDEFVQELTPLERNYLLELCYDPMGNFLDYKIICFTEPSKEQRFLPFERQTDDML